MMLASSIIRGAAATSRCGGVRWRIVSELVDLDLCSYDVRMDLLGLWSVREFVELVESDSEIALMAGWAMTIFDGLRGHFCISATLAIGFLR